MHGGKYLCCCRCRLQETKVRPDLVVEQANQSNSDEKRQGDLDNEQANRANSDEKREGNLDNEQANRANSDQKTEGNLEDYQRQNIAPTRKSRNLGNLDNEEAKRSNSEEKRQGNLVMEKLTAEIKNQLGANHIMLSYNWTSAKELTQNVHDSLICYNLPIWMDTAGGVHGSIAGSMADAVEGASIIIPFMTEKYQESKACNQEIEYANDIGVHVVPIKAQSAKADGKQYRPRGKLGIICAGKLYVDFTDVESYDGKIEELLINIGFALIDPEKVMKLVQEGKKDEGKEDEDSCLEDVDRRIPITVVTKDMQLESWQRGYTETELEGPVLSISLLEQDSKALCVLGDSFGFIGNRVWADNGARGKFRVVYTTSRSVKVISEEGDSSRTISLQGFNMLYKERIMDKNIKEMQLVKQLSKSACIPDVSYGFKESKVWVDKGARGIFKIIYE